MTSINGVREENFNLAGIKTAMIEWKTVERLHENLDYI